MAKNDTDHTLSKRKRRRRIPLYIAGGIVALALLALGITQTGWFRSKLRDIIEDRAGDALNASITIGELDGSLFTSFELKSVALAMGPDTVLTVDRIRATYRFLPLLFRRLLVDSVAVDTPVFYLRNLMKGSGKDFPSDVPAEQDTMKAEEGDLLLDIVAEHIALNGGAVVFESSNEKIPKEIRHISLRASASIADSLRALSLLHLSFSAREPDFVLHSLSFEAAQNNEGIRVRDLSIRTAQNEISARADYGEPIDRAASADLEADSLSLREFAFLLGEFRLGVSPDFSLDAHVQRDTLRVSAGLNASGQRIDVGAIFSNIGILQEPPDTTGIQYDLRVSLKDFDPGQWLDNAAVASRINGSLNVSGKGVSPEAAEVTVEGRFFNSAMWDRSIDNLNVTARYRRGDTSFRLQLLAPSGRSVLSGRIQNLTARPEYIIEATVEGLNLALASADTSWKSDLNGSISIDGTGFDADRLRARAEIRLSRSTFSSYIVDTLAVRGSIRDGNIDLPALLIETGDIGLTVQGSGSLDDRSFMAQGEARIDGTEGIAKFLPFEKLDAEGRLTFNAAGRADSLSGAAGPSLARIRMDETTVDSLSGSFEFTIARGRPPFVASKWNIHGINRPGLPPIHRLAADAGMAGDTLTVAADLTSEDLLRLNVQTALFFGAATEIELRALDMEYRNQQWTQVEAPARVRIDSTGYAADRLVLRSGDGEDGMASRLFVQGVFATRGRHDLHVAGDRLDVSKLMALYDSSLAVAGGLTLRANLKGDVKQPSYSLRAVIQNGSAVGVRFDSLSTRLAFEEDSVDVAAHLAFVDYPPLHVNGYIPVHFPAGEGEDLLPSDKPLFVQVHADSLPLGPLRMLTRRTIEEISGYAACSVSVRNTIADPEFAGGARVLCPQLKIPQYGVDYRDISAYATLAGNRITLDSLRIYREKGIFAAFASTEWRGGPATGKLESLSARIRIRDFPAVRHEQYDMEISGRIEADISADSARFGGDIAVHRTRLYLPALTGNSTSSAATDPDDISMLVEALRDTAATGAAPPSTEERMGPEAPPLATNDLYRRLRGTIQLNLSRNTWIVSPDMRVELQGSVDIIKKQLQPELFGSIRTVRGYYELYGRRFRVEEGELVFQGGSDFNPRLAIKTIYQFRDANREQRKLVLIITGTARMPELTFEIGGTEIPEGDAMAFILFGRSFDSLTFGQRGTVSQTGGEAGLASKIASGFLAGQIEKQLGRELNLDVVEIEPEGDWSGATFEVGKYLTNNLFVSYQSGFGTTVDNEVIPREVKLEYELTPSLFLRLNESDTRSTGFDLIWRLQTD